MALKLKAGDYVPDGAGGLLRPSGEQEALLERVLFRLTARRGALPFLPTVGSRLWTLGALPAGQRLGAARQYAAEALADETELQATGAALESRGDGAALRVQLSWEGGTAAVTLDVQ